ncbi:hypothetical protein VQ042_24545 [Aurantimonas sp. A2-1-M11]|uniref:hypothetical protein n=1 Tax=Aurantimonas sp. A2-1-M11 TaxID=3113712 RepID=UPI002F94DCE3
MVSHGFQALVVEDDPIIAAFLENVLLSREMEVDCISLPGRFDRLLRQNYHVAVVGIDGERRFIPLILNVLQRRRIPPVLFSAGEGNSHWIAANFPEIRTCHYDPPDGERIADYAMDAAMAGTKYRRC